MSWYDKRIINEYKKMRIGHQNSSLLRRIYQTISFLLKKARNKARESDVLEFLSICNRCVTDSEKKEKIIQQFSEQTGYSPDIDNPQTFNEKMQWLKLYYQDSLMTQCADKYEVRNYVKEHIGEQYLINLLGAYNDVNLIDFDNLPFRFVLKVNHGAAQNIICKNKEIFNRDEAIKKLKIWIKPSSSHYYHSYEWSYKNIKPMIVCEEFIENIDENGLKDYKFMCFNGRAKLVLVCSERWTGLKIDYFDLKWNKMPFIRHYQNNKINFKKPINFHLMVQLAEKLSKPFPFVRVDFYEVNEKVYFGEMTFYPGNGMLPFTPVDWDYKLGKMLKLPKKEDLPKNKKIDKLAYSQKDKIWEYYNECT